MLDARCVIFLLAIPPRNKRHIAHVFLDEENYECYSEMTELRIPDCESDWGTENDRLKYICRCRYQCCSGMNFPCVAYPLSDLLTSEFVGETPNYLF